jgi:hypothetical protein
MLWWEPTAIGMLAWPVALAALTLMLVRAKVPWRARGVAAAFLALGVAIGWYSPNLGTLFHVWWRKEYYTDLALQALSSPPQGQSAYGDIQVGYSGERPVRVAFFWFAAHGDVDGIVYDLSGEVANGPQRWLYESRATHLFGPWFRFNN